MVPSSPCWLGVLGGGGRWCSCCMSHRLPQRSLCPGREGQVSGRWSSERVTYVPEATGYLTAEVGKGAKTMSLCVTLSPRHMAVLSKEESN